MSAQGLLLSPLLGSFIFGSGSEGIKHGLLLERALKKKLQKSVNQQIYEEVAMMELNSFQEESPSVEKRKMKIEEIPSLIYRPKGKTGPYPTVINYHGWSSNKEFQHFKATILANFGYQVIVPDALYHGERGSLNYTEAGKLESYLHKVLLQSIEESGKIIEYAIKELEADRDNISVIGHSMGGFTSAGVFLRHPNLKTMVVINGSCAWEKMLMNVNQKQDKKENLSKELRRLEEMDPYNNLEKFHKRPFLLIHGIEDDTVPIEPQGMFFEKAKKHYGKDQKYIRFYEIPKMPHAVSMYMFEQVITWLGKY